MIRAASTDEILAKLVAFDTTSFKSNLELVQFIQQWLDQYGIRSQLVKDETGNKANLYATCGPADKGGVMLSGHTDVVPVAGQQWHSEPFTLTKRDKCWFGRGSADMKGFIACVLSAVPAMVEKPLKTPIHLAFSYDEEVGCLGVRRLIDMLTDAPVIPAIAIIGEPTLMQPISGHKGKVAYNVVVHGREGHSAVTTDGVNAIEYAARLINFINQLHRKIAVNGPFNGGYQVPHTTLHTGTISGGTALNIIPNHCEFNFEIRNLPEHPPEELIRLIGSQIEDLSSEMSATDKNAHIKLTQTISYPGLNTDPSSHVVSFVNSLLDTAVEPGQVSFGTEAGLFSEALGIPSVVCGPGNIADAHKPDEFVAIEQLENCDAMMRRLVSYCQQHLLEQA